VQIAFSVCTALALLAPGSRPVAAQSSTNAPAPQQTPASTNDDAAAKAAARKKKFEATKRRLDSDEGGLDSSSGELRDSSPMRIIYLTPYIGTNNTNRLTADTLRVEYELDQDFSQGFLEVVSAGSVTARYPLLSLGRGRHSMNIPRGISLANDPYTFTCNLTHTHYDGVTEPVNFLWDNRNQMTLQYPTEEDGSIYDYQSGPPPEERYDPPADEAAGFRGEEPVIISSNIPHKRNRLLLSTGRPPEIQILGVNFEEGGEVVCTKESEGNPPIEAIARLHDVRTVSTASHKMNDSIPVLRAGRFDVPERIAAHGTFIRPAGTTK
jgi:hypothetical protein